MRVPKETGTAMCLFFVYSAWGIAPKRNFPQHGTKRNRHCNVPVFLFIRHGEFAPKRNFPQHGTKRNRHCNVPVFCLFSMGNLRPSATSHNTVPKETGTTMCLFFCLFGMWNLRPSATSHNTATKVDRHCNVPVFVYSACGICAQAQLPTARYQKKQALQCACFLLQ